MTETITRQEIDRIKKEFVLRNTLLSPVKAAEILGYSVKKIYRLVESGDLQEANDTPGRQGVRVTAMSVELYREKIVRLAAVAKSGQSAVGG